MTYVRACLVLTALGVVLTVCSPAYAAESRAAESGNDWRALSEVPKLMYIVGVIDAWQIAAYLVERLLVEPGGLSPTTAKEIGQVVGRPYRCPGEKGMTRGQVLAIVEQYMSKHPEDWHQPMSGLISQALDEVCTPARAK